MLLIKDLLMHSLSHATFPHHILNYNFTMVSLLSKA